ncbi:MAG TPA: hypothetical protein VMO47_04130 [Rhodothermales bacterium]|nr:hypothetical protein [Rhodothermales bacterium]
MARPGQASRIRTIALLISGVLPLAIQPSALAGQIAASRNVDRMVGELPNPISIEELVRLLSNKAQDESESSDSDVVPGDVIAVIAQCRLMSLMSDSAALQGVDVELGLSAMAVAAALSAPAPVPELDRFLTAPADYQPLIRRLSDEQPLGP